MADLPDAERLILYDGMTGGSLIDILNGWVPDEDDPYWNRKGAYVPQLIPAALSLLQRGMIEVWEEPWDPNEDLSRCADLATGNTEPMTALYSVLTTEIARQQGSPIWNGRTD